MIKNINRHNRHTKKHIYTREVFFLMMREKKINFPIGYVVLCACCACCLKNGLNSLNQNEITTGTFTGTQQARQAHED